MRYGLRMFLLLGGLAPVLLAGAWALSRPALAGRPAATAPGRPEARMQRPTTPAPFTDVTTATVPALPAVSNSSIAWGDYDNDGRLDFLILGAAQSGGVSQLYHNTGSGFADASAVVQGGLPQLSNGSVAWGDYDNDGRLDFLITGFSAGSQAPVSRLYHNTGSGFADASAGVQGALPQVYASSVAWGDFNNDGRLDFLILGSSGNSPVSMLYRNTGSGFVDDSGSVLGALPQLEQGSVAWGDYDGDGRLDFLITGYTGDVATSVLYHNTGTGFVDASTIVQGGLPQLYDSSAAWGDYDSDGRLDLLISGIGSNGAPLSALYHNTGVGFVDDSARVQGGLPQVGAGSMAWGDYDNDGRLDFLISGQTATGSEISALYQNTGGQFGDSTPSGLPQVYQGSVAWGDYDGDGRLDFLISGLSLRTPTSNLYHNDGLVADTPPGPPANLTLGNVTASSVTLNWTAASDPQTPAGGLSYNLRIGTTPGGGDVVGPMADPSTGARRVVGPGPIQALSATVIGLRPYTTYYWSVQAIDSAWVGGPFAAVATFQLVPQPVLIAGGAGNQQTPRVSGNLAVWEDDSSGSWDVYARDLGTGAVIPVATGPGDQRKPTIDGSLVAWQDNSGGPWAINGAYIISDTVAETFSVASDSTDQTNPVASGSMVVWESAAPGSPVGGPCTRCDVLARDTTSGRPALILSPPSTTNVNPAIDGNLVVWQTTVPTMTLKAPTDENQWDIVGYNLRADTALTVSVVPGDKTNPAISGQVVVWQFYDEVRNRWTVDGSNVDGSGQFTTTTSGDEQMNPAISDNLVVFQDRAPVPTGRVPFPYTTWTVRARDLGTGNTFPVSNGPGDATNPAASGGTIVWNQTDPGGQLDVYGNLGGGTCQPSYHDVSSADYFYVPVGYLSCVGAISGYGDGSFRPFNTTTRGQLSKIMVLAAGWPIDTTGGPHFSDVPSSQPFYSFIETAYRHGVISGYSDGTFRPYANVTRGQLSKIIVGAVGWTLLTPPSGTFADVLPGSAFYPFVETAAAHGIISGYACGGANERCDGQHRPFFRQYNSATRGQLSKIIYLAIMGSGGLAPAP